jgi:predicted GTPase
VEPLNWPTGLPIPSPEQRANIKAIAEDRRKRFSDFLGRDVTVVPYSTVRGFNLEDLFTSLLEHSPQGRKWVFGLIKSFRFEDWMPRGSVQSETSSTRSGGILDVMQRFLNRPVSNMENLSNDELSVLEKQALEERRKRQS